MKLQLLTSVLLQSILAIKPLGDPPSPTNTKQYYNQYDESEKQILKELVKLSKIAKKYPTIDLQSIIQDTYNNLHSGQDKLSQLVNDSLHDFRHELDTLKHTKAFRQMLDRNSDNDEYVTKQEIQGGLFDSIIDYAYSFGRKLHDLVNWNNWFGGEEEQEKTKFFIQKDPEYEDDDRYVNLTVAENNYDIPNYDFNEAIPSTLIDDNSWKRDDPWNWNNGYYGDNYTRGHRNRIIQHRPWTYLQTMIAISIVGIIMIAVGLFVCIACAKNGCSRSAYDEYNGDDDDDDVDSSKFFLQTAEVISPYKPPVIEKSYQESLINLQEDEFLDEEDVIKKDEKILHDKNIISETDSIIPTKKIDLHSLQLPINDNEMNELENSNIDIGLLAPNVSTSPIVHVPKIKVIPHKNIKEVVESMNKETLKLQENDDESLDVDSFDSDIDRSYHSKQNKFETNFLSSGMSHSEDDEEPGVH